MPTTPAVPHLTPNALTVLEKRYLWKNDDGAVTETPAELFSRVAKAVAYADVSRGGAGARRQWEKIFLEMMVNRRFMPNTPTLMNAGRSDGQLSACFVIPVEDSLDGIFGALKASAKIHQSGGGTGFGFSRLRAGGSIVRSTRGVASGPVSFIRIFDVATETIKQGGARRGANMAVLRVDHPDILEFIDCKRDLTSIANFNISVGATDEFMDAVRTGRSFALRDPRDGKVVRELAAVEIFDRIVQAAWFCGDPGMVFLDRMNFLNPTPNVGSFEATNPCGEQPLLAFESCNLGSLNLGEYFRDGGFDWAHFRADIRAATRFLDNVIDANRYPVEESRQITLRNRKIGLGVMGFADLLLYLDIPYGDPRSVELGERIMSVLDREAKRESVQLARERGPFPNFKGSLWDRLGFPPMRNATVSTVAPTGTISIIAGASSGIEPIFSGVFYRNVLSGARLLEVHPAVERGFTSRGKALEGVDDTAIARVLGDAWVPAHAVSVERHLAVQAAFQRHSDSAVSKTINLSEKSSPDDVRAAYLGAYARGCKGITVYRSGSRPTQVLEQAQPTSDAAFCPSC